MKEGLRHKEISFLSARTQQEVGPFLCKHSTKAVALSTEAGKISLGALPTTPDTTDMSQQCQTCSEKRSGSIVQPGTPQFSCSAVDPVLLPWKLILGVEVVVAHRRIDFGI